MYGYDIGDLTGNDKPDLVISLKKPKARWNDVFIYFFTTQDEGFELIKVISRRYNDDPLEVAFYIENGTCFVTDKVKDRYWQVDGYSIQKFVFRQVYHWTNHPLPGGTYGIQVDSDYRTMKTLEIYYKSESLAQVLKNRYLTVPAYPSDLRIPADLPYVVTDTGAAMVLEGVSSWSGLEDCRLSTFARYDSATLFLSAAIADDVVSGGAAGDERDEVQFWLQCTGAEKLSYQQGAWMMDGAYNDGTLGIGIAADSNGLFTQLTIRYAGFSKKQQTDIARITSRSVQLRSGGRLIQCRVPRALLSLPEGETELGYAVAYRDVDRLAGKIWTSLLATSENFMEGVPYTFGTLKFIADTGSPFERDDFRMRPLLKELTNVGVLPR